MLHQYRRTIKIRQHIDRLSGEDKSRYSHTTPCAIDDVDGRAGIVLVGMLGIIVAIAILTGKVIRMTITKSQTQMAMRESELPPPR